MTLMFLEKKGKVNMFQFNYGEGASVLSVWAVWLVIFVILFVLNEVTRRSKVASFIAFVILPTILSALWFTVLRDVTYTDWFHLAKVYSSLAGCIGFWCIRHLHGKSKKTGKEWRLSNSKIAQLFPPLILAINICEAVMRDIEIGMTYQGVGYLADEGVKVVGGSWNFMNAVAGILNIITITGWIGICIRKQTKSDKSRDLIWPDMSWPWIIAYTLWNFTYTYNCLPHHSWYCGFALLLLPIVTSLTVGKGAWLQHRAHSLALWCMFAQTFPSFIDEGKYVVSSTYSESMLFLCSFLALAMNVVVLAIMIFKVLKTKRNPYKGELYTDTKYYQSIKELAE